MLPDGYDLVDQISSTAFSQVWEARDEHGAVVVLKLAPDREDKQRRFQREIEALSAARGPHTMPVLDHDDTFSWYAMPRAQRTLSDHPLPASLPGAIAVVGAIAEALRPIHARGQVHRDLKPANILWLDDGSAARWVVADFGIVRNPRGETTAPLTRTGGLLGSEGWAAPELYRDPHAATAAADVYGAGAILSWMATGEHPAGGVELPGDPALRAVVRRATAASATSRYASVDALLAALEALTAPRRASIADLVASRDYAALGPFVLGHPDYVPEVVEALPRLDRAAVRQWEAADPDGLEDALGHLLGELSTDLRGISFRTVDRFLSWCLAALRAQLARGRADAAEELATALFSAIADIRQFEPARAVLDFLDGLGERDQRVMESALHASTGLDFFRAQAAGRWRTAKTSRLVRDLMDG